MIWGVYLFPGVGPREPSLRWCQTFPHRSRKGSTVSSRTSRSTLQNLLIVNFDNGESTWIGVKRRGKGVHGGTKLKGRPKSFLRNLILVIDKTLVGKHWLLLTLLSFLFPFYPTNFEWPYENDSVNISLCLSVYPEKKRVIKHRH